MGAFIAALYVVLTYVANMLGIASGVIQVRLSEILTIMPVFTPWAIPGLVVGCLFANILGVKYSCEDLITIEPFAGNLTFAKGSVPTRFGKVDVEWEISEDLFRMKITSPANVDKKIILPDGNVIITDKPEETFECKLR